MKIWSTQNKNLIKKDIKNVVLNKKINNNNILKNN